MHYRFQLGNAEHSVRLQPQPRVKGAKTYLVEIGERVYHVRLDHAQPGRLHFTVDGHDYTISVAVSSPQATGIKQRYIALTDGKRSETRHYECTVLSQATAQTAAARPGAAPIGRGDLDAHMPGQVVQVMVSAGDQVVAGQPLLVLEAMKMTMRVVAPAPGRVAQVLVAQGDRVERGQRLVQVEPVTT